jgi:hypothetical protein
MAIRKAALSAQLIFKVSQDLVETINLVKSRHSVST